MTEATPGNIATLWFPEGDATDLEEHIRLWNWRMRGGAHAAVIARFGRHPHRNAVLGRASVPQERDYIALGQFPHIGRIEMPPGGRS